MNSLFYHFSTLTEKIRARLKGQEVDLRIESYATEGIKLTVLIYYHGFTRHYSKRLKTSSAESLSDDELDRFCLDIQEDIKQVTISNID